MDRYVCENCFTDAFLRETVRDNIAEDLDPSCCEFCDREAPCADLESIVEVVEQALMYHYADAAEESPYDGREGGYLYPNTDTYNLLYEEGFLECCAEHTGDSLMERIAEQIEDRPWTKRAYGMMWGWEKLSRSWDRLSEYVKHQRRFFFLDDEPEPEEYEPEQLLSPSEILERIASYCDEHGLITMVPAGTLLYRVRPQRQGERWEKALELGPPPPESASQSRMSPAGVVMTYLAQDPATALAEILPRKGSRRSLTYAMATFTSTRDIRVVNVAAELIVPSFFDISRADTRDQVIFLKKFQRTVSQPVEDRERVDIDYIPTQVITEYFRVSPLLRRNEVMGIAYASSQAPGTNLVLFGDRSLLALGDNELASLSLQEREVRERNSFAGCLRLSAVESLKASDAASRVRRARKRSSLP